ncbi:MAG: amino acid--tRNA ligase-related protein [Candidatus Comchoanobacterales bacterium]
MKNDAQKFSDLLKTIRQFFYGREALELLTHPLSPFGNPDPYVEPLKCEAGFLHTSPEFEMKKYLSQGGGDCFQICHVFRQEEKGAWHREAFIMLEWYRLATSMQGLIDEVILLLNEVLGPLPVTTMSYDEMFKRGLSIDIKNISLQELRAVCIKYDMAAHHWSFNDCLFALQAVLLEPGFNGLTVIRDYPSDQASLAKVGPDGKAKRFEIYVNSIELANGFEELNNTEEQRLRFCEQNEFRARNKLSQIPIDSDFLNALKTLPDCSGVALGVDRLFAIKQGHQALVTNYFKSKN